MVVQKNVLGHTIGRIVNQNYLFKFCKYKFKMNIIIEPSAPPIMHLFHSNACTNDAWWHTVITVVYVMTRKNRQKNTKRGTGSEYYWVNKKKIQRKRSVCNFISEKITNEQKNAYMKDTDWVVHGACYLTRGWVALLLLQLLVLLL